MYENSALAWLQGSTQVPPAQAPPLQVVTTAPALPSALHARTWPPSQ